MFRHTFRNVKIFWAARSKPPLLPTQESSVDLKVRFTDLDYNLHMNNARFVEAFEMGRMDMVVRNGLYKLIFKPNGYQPFVGSVHVRYLSPLKLWQRYQISSKVVGWDHKWVYMTQRIDSDNKLCALAIVKAIFRNKTGTISPFEILKELGHDLPSPEIPKYLTEWIETESLWKEGRSR